MPPFIFLITIFYLAISFLSDVVDTSVSNPFLSYFDVELRFIINNLTIFILVILLLTIVVAVLNISKKKKVLKGYGRFALQLMAINITGFFLAFAILFVVAFVEVNLLAVIIRSNPSTLGIVVDPNSISDKLKEQNTPPVVIANGRNGGRLPITVAVSETGKNSFFGSRILTNFPSALVFFKINPEPKALLIGNSLIVSDLNSLEFQEISPVVSYLMIKKYFSDRNIKSFPEVSLMDKNEYLAYRQEDFKNKISEYDNLITETFDQADSLSEAIDGLEKEVLDNQDQVKELSTKREKEYTKCVNVGVYEDGVFTRTNTKEYCQEQISDLEAELKELKDSGVELSALLEKDKAKLVQYQAYEKYYQNQKVLTQEESTYISYEFGTFNPPDAIKITLSKGDSTQATADFFELLVHEYLHYARYEENGKRISSSFFDEGLTEYFARNIIKYNLGVDTNLGYPVSVKLISQIAKRIDEGDLADVYFANDQEALQKILDRAYGEDFYKNNIILFETLQFTSNTKQILQIANDIMNEIGGDSINEKDLSTTYSTFQ